MEDKIGALQRRCMAFRQMNLQLMLKASEAPEQLLAEELEKIRQLTDWENELEQLLKVKMEKKEFLDRLMAYTNEELVDAFNKEVGKTVWFSARANYLFALRAAIEARGWDYTAIGDEKSMSYKRKVTLEGNKLLPRDPESNA